MCSYKKEVDAFLKSPYHKKIFQVVFAKIMGMGAEKEVKTE